TVRAPRANALQLHHDVARDRVVVQREYGQVLAVAGALEPSMGHFADGGEVSVDPGDAVLEAGRYLHGTADIAGPDRGGETVFGVIGPLDGFLGIGEARDRDDGAKDLPLHYLIGLAGAGDNGGLVEEAASRARAAAGGDLDVGKRRGALHEVGD